VKETAATPSEPILIELDLDRRHGRVLSGSHIGDAAFRPGGTTVSRHADDTTVTKLRCHDGKLTIAFYSNQSSRNQRSCWHVLSATESSGRPGDLRRHSPPRSRQSCSPGRRCVAWAAMADLPMPADRAGGDAAGADGAVVEAHELSRVYGEGDTAVHALRRVTLAVERGKLTAVMGPSGSGKSTLMHLLAALDEPTEGHVTIAGTRLGELSDTEVTKLRREHIGFIFQFFNLLPMLTAEQNIVLPLTLGGKKPEAGFFDDLLEKVGLQDRRKHRPSELSGGQQQRVAIARALVSRPSVVFADEPTGNLDSKTGGEILDLLRGSVQDYGQTLVMVTHDARAAATADRILFIADGLIVKELRGADEHQVLAVVEEIALR
jgi:putative ABC transport system ATP-binding protein